MTDQPTDPVLLVYSCFLRAYAEAKWAAARSSALRKRLVSRYGEPMRDKPWADTPDGRRLKRLNGVTDDLGCFARTTAEQMYELPTVSAAGALAKVRYALSTFPPKEDDTTDHHEKNAKKALEAVEEFLPEQAPDLEPIPDEAATSIVAVLEGAGA